MIEDLTVAEAVALGYRVVESDPDVGPVLHVGDVITHVASGRDLRIVRIVSERVALAELLRFRRARAVTPPRVPPSDRGHAH